MFSLTKQGRRNKGGKASKWHFKLRSLWVKNPFCYHCDELTTLHDRFCDSYIHGQDQKNHAATLDHLYSNLDIRRLLKGGDKVVISCYYCNNHRSSREVRQVFPNLYDVRNNYVSIKNILNGITMAEQLTTMCIMSQNIKR